MGMGMMGNQQMGFDPSAVYKQERDLFAITKVS
jgi:hypothetical protein